MLENWLLKKVEEIITYDLSIFLKWIKSHCKNKIDHQYAGHFAVNGDIVMSLLFHIGVLVNSQKKCVF